MTSSCHRCRGLPTGLVPLALQSNNFPIGLAQPIHCIFPSHLILCALMNLTTSAPSIKLSISMLFCILQTLSILTGPNIFLNLYFLYFHTVHVATLILLNPLAYADVCETAGLARSINTQPAVRRNSETNPTSQHNRGMY